MSTEQPTATTTWNFDPSHSVAEFSVKHVMIATVKGRFGQMEGTVRGSLDNLAEATVEASIPADSISTFDDKRDEHLRSADFFEVDKYPKLTFRSTRIEPAGSDEYKLTGDLTIRDVAKEVTFDVTFDGTAPDPFVQGGRRAAFSAETKINRKDFGLKWNAALEAGGVMVGDEVKISLHVEMVQQA